MTERAEHVGVLANELRSVVEGLFVLHGRLPKRTRIETVEKLNALHDEVPRVLVATGRLIGEGFDHPRFDTMSQAKRVAHRFEHFKEVVLDFDGVAEIGQAFADELFRVFTGTHPDVRLRPINTSEAVAQMVRRAMSGSAK